MSPLAEKEEEEEHEKKEKKTFNLQNFVFIVQIRHMLSYHNITIIGNLFTVLSVAWANVFSENLLA